MLKYILFLLKNHTQQNYFKIASKNFRLQFYLELWTKLVEKSWDLQGIYLQDLSIHILRRDDIVSLMYGLLKFNHARYNLRKKWHREQFACQVFSAPIASRWGNDLQRVPRVPRFLIISYRRQNGISRSRHCAIASNSMRPFNSARLNTRSREMRSRFNARVITTLLY